MPRHVCRLPASHHGGQRSSALDAYGKLPLSFVPNAGQTDQSVRYYAQGSGFSFFFTEDKAVLSFAKGERGQALELHFLGSSPDATLEAGDSAPGTVNYLTAGASHTNLPTYQQLTYREPVAGHRHGLRRPGRKPQVRVPPGARAPIPPTSALATPAPTACP